MSLPVIVLPGATADINQLADQRSPASRTALLAALADKVRLIEQMPEMYPVSRHYPALRRCVVLPTISLLYRLQPAAIEIVAVIDVRRDPSGLARP